MIYLDLDETIARTWHLQPYRKTKEGREYIARNINGLNTPLIHPVLAEIAKRCTILTNAPLEYAQALTRKLGIEAPIIAAANKPFTKLQPEALVIGDEARDVLTAHHNKLPSIGTAWGYSTKEQLEQAQATAVITKPEELPDLMIEFEKGKLKHQPKQTKYDFLPASEWNTPAPDIDWKSIGTYYPVGDENFDDFSGDLLDFKTAKNQTFEEIKSGNVAQFYTKGRIIGWNIYLQLFQKYIRQVNDKINPESAIIPVPNSLPEYCYKTDVNFLLVRNVNAKRPETRIIHREYPKPESHTGSRDKELHYATMSIENTVINGDITIFDDITTSGAQIEAVARLFRWKGHKGKIYALTLGKTRDTF